MNQTKTQLNNKPVIRGGAYINQETNKQERVSNNSKMRLKSLYLESGSVSPSQQEAVVQTR